MILAGAVAAFGCGIGVALAADNEAGVPLSPAEAAGGWTLQSAGHAICMLRLTANHLARAGDCGGALPSGVAGWATTSNGVALTGADGQVLMRFDRWSNSLFVSRRTSGDDLQLMRGAPNVRAGSSNAGLAPAPTP
jgi:hypothetical protein